MPKEEKQIDEEMDEEHIDTHYGSGKEGGVDTLFEEMKRERDSMETASQESLERAGMGLYRGQVELKHAPWKLTWSRLDMMLDRQERMIGLLWEINENIKEFIRTADPPE